MKQYKEQEQQNINITHKYFILDVNKLYNYLLSFVYKVI
jgi:hypothetical protein